MAGQDLSLESQVQSLSRALAELSERVRVLEGRSAGAAPQLEPLSEDASPAASEVAATPALATHSAGRISALAGRAVLVLAGGFLLRAVSDAGIAPKLAVALVGMLYAATWMLMALRRKGEVARAAAFFDVGAGALVAFPLIAEITIRFALVSAPLGAGATLAFAGLTTWLGLRLGHKEIVWTGGWFGAGTMLALAFGTHAFVPVIVALVLGAAALEALVFAGREVPIRWLVAGALNACVAAFLVVLTGDKEVPESYPAFSEGLLAAALVAMAGVYLCGAAVRSLLREREVDAFSAVQVPLAVLIGLGGAFAISAEGGGMATVTAALLLVLGLGGYALSFTFADRRQGHTRNFYFYSTIGGLMLLFGSSLLLDGGLLTITWAALAALSAGLGVRFDRFTLRLHGAIYVAATFLSGGLYPRLQERLVASPSSEWISVGAFGAGALILTMLCSLLLSRRARESGESVWQLFPELLTLVHGGLGLAALSIGLLSAGLGHEAGVASPAVLSVLRTAVLSLVAMVLAWLGAHRALREAGWLVWPVLLACGARLAVDDLRRGTALSICISLACFGTALILASRQKSSPS